MNDSLILLLCNFFANEYFFSIFFFNRHMRALSYKSLSIFSFFVNKHIFEFFSPVGIFLSSGYISCSMLTLLSRSFSLISPLSGSHLFMKLYAKESEFLLFQFRLSFRAFRSQLNSYVDCDMYIFFAYMVFFL